MALPVTISSSHNVSPELGSTRPLRSMAGDIYVILASASSTALAYVQDGDLIHVVAQRQPSSSATISPRAFKATDPTDSFTAVDTGGEPSWTSDSADSELWYSRFDMATDAWVDVDTSDPDILVDDVQDSSNAYAVGITLRSDGDIVVVYQKHRHKFMGVDRPAVGAAVSTNNGVNWTAEIHVSETQVAEEMHLGAIVIPPGNSDQAHIFWGNGSSGGSGDIQQRAMASDNTLQTLRDTGFSMGVNRHNSVSAMAFVRGGTTLVQLLHVDGGQDPSVYEMDAFPANGHAADFNPLTTDARTEIVAENVEQTTETSQLDFVFDPGTETIHELHVDAADNDIQHHDDQGTNTWQDNGEVVTGNITGGGPFCNIYERDGAKIGYVYEDSGGNVIYNEIDVTPSTTALSEVDMGEQNLYHGPFEIGGDHYTVMTINGHDIVAVKATPAIPVDADWNSVDTPIRVPTVISTGPGIIADEIGWRTQDPVKSIWVHESPYRSYLFDVSDAGPTDPDGVWGLEENGFDGDKSSGAVVAVPDFGDVDNNEVEGQGTAAPASGPAISSVAVQIRGRNSDAVAGFRVTTDAAAETLLDTTHTFGGSAEDVEFSLSTPSGGWTWAKIQALEVRFWLETGGGSAIFSMFGIWAVVTMETNDLHVATQQESGRVAYHVFDPDSDTWIVRDELVANHSDTDFGTDLLLDPAVSLALRSDGDVVLLAGYHTTSAQRDHLRVFTRQSGSWNNEGEGTDEINDYTGVFVVGPDSSDRISWYYKDDDTEDNALNSISAADVIDGQTQIENTVDTAIINMGPGVIDSANKIYAPYIDVSNQISISTWTSGASPTTVQDADVSDVAVFGHGRTTPPYCAVCLAVDGTDVHLLYVDDADQDIQHDDDVENGGTTDVELVAGVGDIARVSCNIYSTALHYLYDDAGVTKYGTLSLGGVVRKPGRLLLLGVGHGGPR